MIPWAKIGIPTEPVDKLSTRGIMFPLGIILDVPSSRFTFMRL